MIKDIFRPRVRILWAVLAALCFLYSIMVYLVGSGTFSFIIWLGGVAFFGLCFFLAGKNRWKKAPVAIKGVSYVLLTAVALVFLLCQICILSHFFDRGEKNLDYIIVLGAQMRSSGPSVIYRYRLQKAKEYLDDNPGTIIVTTGGQGRNESMSEGDGGKDYLVSLGVSPDRILVENTSLDTVQNIENAMEIIRSRYPEDKDLRIGIVTNGFHVFRGVHIAKKITDARVCGIAAYMQFRFIPNNMVRECFGILRDLLAGKMVLAKILK
ncbi:YdcF family protein [Butyrivibrio sp. AE3009]|uniref:YdcF family protein n=1 Tax=Butyrivibrio sp. AE3009 TaxID=1280666 RepID=UPI0003B4B426|nr:YdcF family protein [Butyrivibrio sp. AE3009]